MHVPVRVSGFQLAALPVQKLSALHLCGTCMSIFCMPKTTTLHVACFVVGVMQPGHGLEQMYAKLTPMVQAGPCMLISLAKLSAQPSSAEQSRSSAYMQSYQKQHLEMLYVVLFYKHPPLNHCNTASLPKQLSHDPEPSVMNRSSSSGTMASVDMCL